MKEEEIAPGIHMIGFNSAEEVFEYMSDAEAQAILSALDEQWRIGWGAYVVRVVEELWIFGRVYSYERAVAEAVGPDGEPDEEGLYELRQLEESYTRGYRYGKWYSTVLPEGEYGSAHVATLWEISETDWVEAQAGGWLPGSGFAFRVGMEIGEALKNKRERKEEE